MQVSKKLKPLRPNDLRRFSSCLLSRVSGVRVSDGSPKISPETVDMKRLQGFNIKHPGGTNYIHLCHPLACC